MPGSRDERHGQGDHLEPPVVIMRKIFAAVAAVALVATIQPAHAAKKSVKTTMYLHGYSQFGDLDGVDNFANGTPPMPMDGNEPPDGPPKSMRNGTPGLNTRCSGLPLGFPTWQGNFSGTIVGDAKLTLHFVSPPTRITARLWTDTPVFSCNDSYIEPASEVVVEVPPGHSEVEVVFPKLKLKGTANIMIELLSSGTGSQGRVFYDSTDMASNLSFKCIPVKGSSCI